MSRADEAIEAADQVRSGLTTDPDVDLGDLLAGIDALHRIAGEAFSREAILRRALRTILRFEELSRPPGGYFRPGDERFSATIARMGLVAVGEVDGDGRAIE
uniref:Uncharacterized protein n=1 Tax=viral metagenome TaxID=1070528 RepID=A0A6M3JB46_9ZZZZ